jgi:DUF1009 family protein
LLSKFNELNRMLPLRCQNSEDTSYDDLSGQTVGLVAGWGNYPIEVAQVLRDRGARVVTVAIRNHASSSLETYSDVIKVFSVGKLGAHQRFFKRHGASKVVLAGKIFKDRVLFSRWRWLAAVPDWKCVVTFLPHFIFRRKDQRDDSILHAVTQSYEQIGIPIVPGTRYARHLLAEEGLLTDVEPSFAIQKDIEFGWKIAKAMGGLDIGQSITVCDQNVFAVEAIEGTDACIRRTKSLCKKGGFTLVKVAKPQQDERFDLPTVGPLTVQAVADAGGKAIAIEQGRTILIDRLDTLRLANQLGIAIVALKDYQFQSQLIAA